MSVIIPTRDRRTLVCEAVASALAQRGCALEVIVVDDGSRDDTAAALAARFGERVRIHHTAGRGVSAARNAGARLARAEWIAFLDSDDTWLPDKLARQRQLHAADPGLEVSQTGEIWVRDGVRVNQCHHHAKPAGDVFVPSLARCLVAPSSVMIRRSRLLAVGGFDETLPVCEDYDLWLRLSASCEIGLVPEALMVKRGGHADQLSRRYWGMDRFRVASLAKLLAAGGLSPARHAAATATLRGKCRILAQGALRRGRADEAARYEAVAHAFA